MSKKLEIPKLTREQAIDAVMDAVSEMSGNERPTQAVVGSFAAAVEDVNWWWTLATRKHYGSGWINTTLSQEHMKTITREIRATLEKEGEWHAGKDI